MLFLSTALILASASVPNQEPHSFSDVLNRARLTADCVGRSPCSAPIAGEPLSDYEAEFVQVLAKFLSDARVRKDVDPNFSFSDWSKFELGLNVLGQYYRCLDMEFNSAATARFATSAEIDALAVETDGRCREHREEALARINFNGPSFTSFDLIADGNRAGAGVSELLQQVRDFSTAFHSGLRGQAWRRAVGVVYTLPAPQDSK